MLARRPDRISESSAAIMPKIALSASWTLIHSFILYVGKQASDIANLSGPIKDDKIIGNMVFGICF